MYIPKNVTFVGVSNNLLRKTFLEAYAAFTDLHAHPLTLRRYRMSGTTMRAQPVMNANFRSKRRRHYRIDLSDHAQLNQVIRLQDLPAEVLIGWFAHELGHLMDYRLRGVRSMLRFLLGYVSIPTYRMLAERRADQYAVAHGFAEQLVATKRYILSHDAVPARYKDRLIRYYPSPEDVALWVQPPAMQEFPSSPDN